MARNRIPTFVASGGVTIAKPNMVPPPNLTTIYQATLTQLTTPS